MQEGIKSAINLLFWGIQIARFDEEVHYSGPESIGERFNVGRMKPSLVADLAVLRDRNQLTALAASGNVVFGLFQRIDGHCYQIGQSHQAVWNKRPCYIAGKTSSTASDRHCVLIRDLNYSVVG